MKPTIHRLGMRFPGESFAMLLTAHTRTGVLVGTMVVKDFAAGTSCEFARLFVDEKFRREGVATALIAEARKIAVEGKASGLCGYATPTNAGALQFYQRHNFIPVWKFADGDHLVWRPL